MAEWDEPHRPALRRRSTPTAARTPTEILVSMGTIADTADRRRRPPPRPGTDGRLRHRHRVPPVPGRELAEALRSARAIAVVERTDDPAARRQPADPRDQGRPLRQRRRRLAGPAVLTVSAGLGSRDVTAGDLVAVFDWLADPAATTRRSVVLGIRHPLALPRSVDLGPAAPISLRGHSVGGFGSVTTNKLARRPSSASSSTCTSRPTRATARRRRACRPRYFLTIADEPIRSHARARAGRLRAAPRRGGLPRRATRSAGSSTAARSSSSRR